VGVTNFDFGCILSEGIVPVFAPFCWDLHRNNSAESSISRAILSDNERAIFQRRERNRSQLENRQRDSLQATEDGSQEKALTTRLNGSSKKIQVRLQVLGNSGMIEL
jgi:hypothetical protein